MTCSWRWFIHPETAISINRNGSIPLCVFKTHYRDCGSAVIPEKFVGLQLVGRKEADESFSIRRDVVVPWSIAERLHQGYFRQRNRVAEGETRLRGDVNNEEFVCP